RARGGKNGFNSDPGGAPPLVDRGTTDEGCTAAPITRLLLDAHAADSFRAPWQDAPLRLRCDREMGGFTWRTNWRISSSAVTGGTTRVSRNRTVTGAMPPWAQFAPRKPRSCSSTGRTGEFEPKNWKRNKWRPYRWSNSRANT